MTRLKPGDKVNCLIKNHIIVPSRDEKYDEIFTFEIVGLGDYGYYLFVPQYYYLQNSIIINPSLCKKLEIEPRFLWEQMVHVTEGKIYEVKSKMDGMRCAFCQDFVLMGAPNRDNGTMLCYSCRQNPYR